MGERLLPVLVVDDEQIVRNGMKNIISWEAAGCEVVGDAGGGEEALRLIEELRPALVLLDITMPGMSGIDVLSEVHRNPRSYPSRPEFLILSGYSDFSYAQKAMNLGARGYIVKPVDEDILAEKVVELVREINGRQQSERLHEDEARRRLAASWCAAFAAGDAAAVPPDECRNGPFQPLLVSPELCAGDAASAAEKAFACTEHLSFALGGAFVVLFRGEGSVLVERHAERFCRQESQGGAVAVLGEPAQDAAGAVASFAAASVLFANLFFCGGQAWADSPFLSAGRVDDALRCRLAAAGSPGGASSADSLALVPELLSAIEVYDLQHIGALLERLSSGLARGAVPPAGLKKTCMAFLLELQRLLYEKHPEKKLNVFSAMELVDLVYSQPYFSGVMAIVRDFTGALTEAFVSGASGSTVMKVVQYVKENFRSDLKLEMLGGLFNCNSAYLGKKFKEYTGVSFNTYLDIIRIDEAKRLMSAGGLKVYEVSRLVGYSNTDYFYLKFRKLTGMTPGEFRASLPQEGGTYAEPAP